MLAAGAVNSDQPLPAADTDRGEPARIEAERLSFDRPANLAIGEGNVIVRYKDATLRADRVRLNTLTKDVWAEGNVRLNRQEQEWVAPSVYYNFETGAMKTENVRGFFAPLIVGADSVSQVDTNHYSYTRATATTCDYERPHYRLEATRGEIWPGDRVVLYNATLRIGDVPVFWFPVVAWGLKGEDPPVGITLGQSSRSGFFILASIHWWLNKDVQLTVHLDERTRRGFGTGADLKYRLGTTGEGLVGGYYINDAEPRDRKDIAAGKDIPTNRYRLQWRHRQELADDIDLKVYLNKLSDSDIIDDFFNDEFQREREPDSVADITKRGANYTLSLLARPHINDFFAEVERLPELKLAVNRMRLGKTGLFYEGESSVAQLHNDPGDTGSTNFVGNAVRADSFHQLVFPQTYFGWLSVVPHAGVRGTYYSHRPDFVSDGEDVTRVVYDLGVETSFKASRTWPNVRHQRLGIDGLRHIVQPFASYQWVPEPSELPDELLQFDTLRSITNAVGESISLTRFSPLHFPAFNTIDAIDRENTLRFGLRQKLQTRREGKPWDLIELTGWTDWRLEHDDGQEDFSDFFGTIELRPWDWVALDLFTRYDLNDGVLRELNVAARVVEADRWSVGLGTRFLKDDSNLISVSQTYRLSRHWAIQAYHRVDMEDGLWEEQDYMLRQDTHDWLISYGVRLRSQRERRDDVTVFFAVTLKAYPGFGLSAKRIDVGGEH